VIQTAAGGVSNVNRIPPLKRLLKVGLGLVFLSTISSLLNARSEAQQGVSIIWLSNGFLMGVLLCAPRRHWTTLLMLGGLVDFGVNIGLHATLNISIYFALCNMIEVIIGAAFMARAIAPSPDLTEFKQLKSFLGYGVLLAPFVASMLSVLGMEFAEKIPFLHALQTWFAADILGVATVTPLYLSFHHRRQFSPRSGLETAGLFLLLIAVSSFIFAVATAPLIWVVLLFLILLGARVGFTGSALGLLLVTFIGGWATVNGHGPIAFGVNGSLSAKILMFQIFVATTMLALYLTEVAMAKNARAQLSLEASETRFRLLAEASRDVIVLAGLDGQRKYVSPAATELLGWSQEELLEMDYRDTTHPEDLERKVQAFCDCRRGCETGAVSFRFRRKDDTYLWVESSMRLYRDATTGEPAGFVYVLRDISERKLAEDRLQDAFNTVEQLALVDGLTGVANRRLMDETLNREWLRALRDGTSLSLLLIDVDHFKLYNDLYGHLAGDACLQMLANAIQSSLRRPPDLLARFGGEEFVIILPNTPAPGAEMMSQKVLGSVAACAIPHSGSPYGCVTVSLGCATTTATMESSPKDLLKAADDAMYRAKTNGRNQIQLASDSFVIH
jgi:diguanylate cyclase (GGDEF)-like protein/PAS domain S-box-containing protein